MAESILKFCTIILISAILKKKKGKKKKMLGLADFTKGLQWMDPHVDFLELQI